MGKDYHINLATYFQSKPLYLDGEEFKKPNVRKLVEQPWQQTKSEMWTDLENTLANLFFVVAKFKAGLSSPLIEDYKRILNLQTPSEDIQLTREEISVKNILRGIPNHIESVASETLASLRNRDSSQKCQSEPAYDPGEIIPSDVFEPDFGAKYVLESLRTNFVWSDQPQSPLFPSGEILPDTCFIPSDTNADDKTTKKNRNEFAGPGGTLSLPLIKDFLSFIERWTHEFQKHLKRIFSYAINSPEYKRVFEVAMNDINSGKFKNPILKIDFPNSEISNPGKIKSLVKHKNGVLNVDVTSDGLLSVSVAHDNKIILWDIDKGYDIGTMPNEDEREVYASRKSVAITPDGRIVASCLHHWDTRIWDVERKQLLLNIKASEPTFLSNNGRLCITGAGLNFQLWDILNKRCLRKETYQLILAISPDARILFTSHSDGPIEVRDLQTGKIVATLIGHKHRVLSFSLTSTCLFGLSADHRGTLRYWDLLTGKCIREIKLPEENIVKAILSKDGRKAVVVSGQHEGKGPRIRLIDLKEDFVSLSFSEDNRTNFIYDICISNDFKRLLTGHSHDVINVWDLTRNTQNFETASHWNVVYSIAVSKKYAFSGGADNSVRIWDIDKKLSTKELTGHTWTVEFIVMSKDGQYLISTSTDGTLKLWNINTGKCIRTVAAGIVQDISFTPDNRLLVSFLRPNSDVRFFNKNLKKETGIRIKFFHESWFQPALSDVWGMAISSNFKYVAIRNSTSSIWLGNIPERKLISLEGHTDRVNNFSFSSNNRILASVGEDNKVMLWELESGKVLRNFYGHEKPVTSVIITPDDGFLITGSYDNTIRLWDIENGRSIDVLNVKNIVKCLAISDDGKVITCGLMNGEVLFLRILNRQIDNPLILNPIYRWNNKRKNQWDKYPTVKCKWCGEKLSIFPDKHDQKILRVFRNPFLKTKRGISGNDLNKVTTCPICSRLINIVPNRIDNRTYYLRH